MLGRTLYPSAQKSGRLTFPAATKAVLPVVEGRTAPPLRATGRVTSSELLRVLTLPIALKSRRQKPAEAVARPATTNRLNSRIIITLILLQ